MNILPKLSSEQILRLRNAVLDPKSLFCFIPFASLRDRIAAGSDEVINSLPQNIKEVFLSMPNGAGLAITNDMVMRYLDDTIDEKNKKILDQGEIRIISEPIEV